MVEMGSAKTWRRKSRIITGLIGLIDVQKGI